MLGVALICARNSQRTSCCAAVFPADPGVKTPGLRVLWTNKSVRTKLGGDGIAMGLPLLLFGNTSSKRPHVPLLCLPACLCLCVLPAPSSEMG